MNDCVQSRKEKYQRKKEVGKYLTKQGARRLFHTRVGPCVSPNYDGRTIFGLNSGGGGKKDLGLSAQEEGHSCAGWREAGGHNGRFMLKNWISEKEQKMVVISESPKCRLVN